MDLPSNNYDIAKRLVLIMYSMFHKCSYVDVGYNYQGQITISQDVVHSVNSLDFQIMANKVTGNTQPNLYATYSKVSITFHYTDKQKEDIEVCRDKYNDGAKIINKAQGFNIIDWFDSYNIKPAINLALVIPNVGTGNSFE